MVFEWFEESFGSFPLTWFFCTFATFSRFSWHIHHHLININWNIFAEWFHGECGRRDGTWWRSILMILLMLVGNVATEVNFLGVEKSCVQRNLVNVVLSFLRENNCSTSTQTSLFRCSLSAYEQEILPHIFPHHSWENCYFCHQASEKLLQGKERSH